jgi:hypothetical protein
MESEDYNTTESGLCRLDKRLKYDGEYEEEEGGEGEREEGEEYRMKRNDDNQEEFSFGNIYSTDFAVFSDKKNQSNDSEKCSDETEIQNSENYSDECGNHIMMLQCLQSPNKKDRMRTEEKGKGKGKKDGEGENEKSGIGKKENYIDEDDTGKILTGKNSLGMNSRFYGSCESKEKNTDGEIDDDSDDENDNDNDNKIDKDKETENGRVFSPSRARLSTVPLAGSPVKAGTVSLSGTVGCISISACIDEIDNYYYEENPEQKRMDMKKLKDVQQHSHAYVRNSENGKEKEIFIHEFLGRLSVGRFSVQSPPRGAGVVGLGTGYGEGMSVSDVSGVRSGEGGEGVEEMEWKSASDFNINNNNNNGNNGNDSMSVNSSNDKKNKSKIVSASKNKNDTQHNDNDRDKENGNENKKTEKDKNNQVEKENEWMKKKLNAKMLSLNIRKNNSLTENNENGDENDMECSTENDCLVLNTATDNDDTNITDDNDNDNDNENDNENDDNNDNENENENEGLDLNIDGCSFGRSVTHCFKN